LTDKPILQVLIDSFRIGTGLLVRAGHGQTRAASGSTGNWVPYRVV